ncbi:NAD(FAD)-utilizing dehydrogenase [Roseivivax halodurans JCM 10272]|uniref:NAD(FAD)-utilizing dehydrogenase n=1 Tax=Roseivivax halodurans JCM 10272 TaxID=1449350 RepID=X7EH76_9RHOB|nr:TIGR03862 family flavoprotein [Roseivivax halodurans]ETX15414.1 NAD(FAD)-utilizing dehydrogenase [Roseivivax halodurans JCM 10272]
MTDTRESVDALVIGGGPAGLMAADALLSAGRKVLLTEQKPSLARKFLMAGKSGLNLTKAEDVETCLAAYGEAAPCLRPMIEALPPEAVATWAEGLGQPVFAGSTGRVFPEAMKASPLLRAWLARLAGLGLETRTRWSWSGWDGDLARFETPDGECRIAPRVTVLACGGASWARLGSDGHWTGPVGDLGAPVAPFTPANAGLRVEWSPHMEPHLGSPLKNIGLRAGALASRGEVVISERGLEGGGLYPLSPALREGAPLELDLAPDVEVQMLEARLRKGPAKDSASNRLRKAARLPPAARALVMECARPLTREPEALASLLKALSVPHRGLAPLDEAISVAGGLRWDGLTEGLELAARPGTFAAGEMLDWEAPTGGYLLTACLATGLWAGRHAALHDG